MINKRIDDSEWTNILSLHLEGFQTISESVQIDLTDMTLLFGPNSSGKSAIKDAIKLAPMVFNLSLIHI